MDQGDAHVGARPRAPRVPRRVLVTALLALVVLGGVLVSAAVLSDSTGNEAMRLEVGTVDVATAPVTLELDATGLVPGDVVATPLEFRNDGSLELRYAVTSTVDDQALADELLLSVRSGVTTCDEVDADSDGTLLAGPTRLGTTTGMLLLGDPATGEDPGDRVLAPGAAEVLCFRVELPSSATEAGAAGLGVTATLGVEAEQTAVNP